MPDWLQYILYFAGALTAAGVIWQKFLKPFARLVSTLDTLLPLLIKINKVFEKNPTAFEVLNEIQAQFRTDSGSSLRDAVDRLEQLAEDNKLSVDDARVASDLLKIGVEATKQLSQMDREERRDLMLKLDRLTVKVATSAATGDRMEKADAVVADNLAQAHERALEADNQPGAAADAAVKPDPEPIRYDKN